MLNYAKCTIISNTSNKYFDSFVLSESSLFVYPYKIMLKTCGTTTLLKCIPKLMEFATSLDLSVEFVMFSRKNFLFPCAQAFPHSDWNAEVEYLNKIFDGTAYLLGPLTTPWEDV
jgi:S-adenosylmethionine decarboxylase